MPRHAKRDILKPNEVEFILNKVEQPHLKAVIVLLYWTGARINEVLSLKVHNIYNEGATLFVDIPTLKTEKVKKDEYIHRRCLQFNWDKLPFKQQFAEFIQTQNNIKQQNDLIWDISRQWVGQILTRISRKYPEECGGQVWCHLFRHTRIQLLADKDIRPQRLRAFTGHKKMQSLEPYLQRSAKRLEFFKDMVDI